MINYAFKLFFKSSKQSLGVSRLGFRDFLKLSIKDYHFLNLSFVRARGRNFGAQVKSFNDDLKLIVILWLLFQNVSTSKAFLLKLRSREHKVEILPFKSLNLKLINWTILYVFLKFLFI